MAVVVGGRLDGLELEDLGYLHRALRLVLTEVEEALTPAIHRAHEEDYTYLEIAAMSGYGSTTTISKIMKSYAGATPPRRGPKPFRRR